MTQTVPSVESDDQSDAPVSMKIVRRVAAASDRDAAQLPPLYDAVDPDALDAVVESAGMGRSPAEIRFPYAGHRVTVSVAETVRVEIADE